MTSFPLIESGIDENLIRFGQYLLTTKNRSVLPSQLLVDNKIRHLKPKQCMTFPVTKHGKIEHKVNSETGKHRFGGLNSCKSVHICPSCSTAIRQCRAARCRMAIGECIGDGGQVPLVTLTSSHDKDDDLLDLVVRFKAARRALHDTRPVRDLKKLVRCQGVVWVMEINFHKLNGWHVHFHELWFCLDQFSNSGLERELFTHWERLCVRHGLKKPERFRVDCNGNHIGLGVNVCGGDRASEYLAKSSASLAAELAGGAKIGRVSDSMTAWQLMDAAFHGANWARRRYIEYARAVHGLGFMSGLKGVCDFFHVDGITEDEVINALSAEWSTLRLFDRYFYETLDKRGLIPMAYEALESGEPLESVLGRLCY